MTNEIYGDRYEVLSLSEDRFINRALVKDLKAHGRNRAILFINDQSLSNPNIVAWFTNQLELCSKIRSDSIVDFIDSYKAGEIMSSPALVVEVPESTLSEFMSRTDIQPETAIRIIKKVLKGINELHELGMLHLDIRPEAVGITNNTDEVKLLSLGNCSSIKSGTMSLTPNAKYGAPECYNPSVEMGRYTDIYSAGFLLYELLGGSKSISNQFESILKETDRSKQDSKWVNWHVCDKQVQSLKQLKPGINDQLSDCVDKMISKDIVSRSGNIGNVIRELASIESVGIVAGTASIAATGAFESKKDNRTNGSDGFFAILKDKWIYVAGALILAMAVALAGVFLLRESPDPEIQIDIDELNALIDNNSNARKVINTLGLANDPATSKPNELTELAIEAKNNDDYVSMFSNLQESVPLYTDFIEANGSKVLAGVVDKLNPLIIRAKMLGTQDLPSITEATSDYADYAELESKYLQYSENIAAFENAILLNNRVVEIGSSNEEIDKAVNACKRYVQGCLRSWYEDELLRSANLGPYKLDENEVTVKEFDAYVEKFSVKTEAELRKFSSKVVDAETDFAVAKVDGLNWKNAYEKNSANLPVVHVTHADAAGYCEHLHKRLPSAEEWEFAARGYERSIYPWGNTWDPSVVYWANSSDLEAVKPVGSFPPSTAGYYDLAGSVSEWTSTLDDSGVNAYVKGASRFDFNAVNIRSAVLRLEPTDYSGEDIGFRCATELDEWPEENE